MQLLIIISDDVHNVALRQARALDTGAPLSDDVLNALLDDEFRTWVAKVWDNVEGALQRAYSEGIEAARPFIDKVASNLTEATAKIAIRGEELRAMINVRLNLYLQETIDGALGRVRPSITIGGRELVMTNVTIEQRIRMSGSLKASLESICEFVAEGEIALAVVYGSAE
ncbi:MAG: hypothetical protein V3S40_01955 [Kiloniellales bacterium]|jgi:hypothetical protein